MRLVASGGGLTTSLLAFDADYKDPNLKFGDGKTDRYYITGWKSSAQKIGWKFRTTKSSTYKILIKYITTGDTGGQYTLKIENKLFTKSTSHP